MNALQSVLTNGPPSRILPIGRESAMLRVVGRVRAAATACYLSGTREMVHRLIGGRSGPRDFHRNRHCRTTWSPKWRRTRRLSAMDCIATARGRCGIDRCRTGPAKSVMPGRSPTRIGLCHSRRRAAGGKSVGHRLAARSAGTSCSVFCMGAARPTTGLGGMRPPFRRDLDALHVQPRELAEADRSPDTCRSASCHSADNAGTR